MAGPNGGTKERKASVHVGGVQKMHRGAPGLDGYGFLIQDDEGKQILALCYKTQKEADDAAEHADQMLAKTIFLTGIDVNTDSP